VVAVAGPELVVDDVDRDVLAALSAFKRSVLFLSSSEVNTLFFLKNSFINLSINRNYT